MIRSKISFFGEYILLPTCKYFSDCCCWRTATSPLFSSGFCSLTTFTFVLCQALHLLTVRLWLLVFVKGKRKNCTAAVFGFIKRLASDYLFNTCVTNFPHFLKACAHGLKFPHSCTCCQVLYNRWHLVWNWVHSPLIGTGLPFLCVYAVMQVKNMKKVFNSKGSTFNIAGRMWQRQFKKFSNQKVPYIR